eukprot:TRINITY_DN34546_c0_g1_i1.p2 TRINITY_DN34546_c0_g1~~TRINITY_DN34546_c0_g1_i1.p2  ORF type:complete len:161 (-),score=12.33 TRINITY_DN34546_c0_g1_i1:286-768(-)
MKPFFLWTRPSPPSWAEHDLVVGTARASESASLVVLWVAVSIWAPGLEEPGKVGGAAAAGVAAVLVGLEHGARVVAAAGGLQLGGALAVDVGRALDPPGAAVGCWAEIHRDVEPIHQGDVKEVLAAELVQSVLRQRVGRLPVCGALEQPTTVPGLALAPP